MTDSASELNPHPVWRTELWPSVMSNDSQSFHAGVFRGGSCLCHILISGLFIDEASGQRALAQRALSWIEAYEARNVDDNAKLASEERVRAF
jgi:hypothetical protein